MKEKTKINLALGIVRRIPRSWLYWCVIHAWAAATTELYTDKSPDEVTWSMVCDFLDGTAQHNAAVDLIQRTNNTPVRFKKAEV